MFKKVENFSEDYRVINNIRCLSLDMINNASSGHPGMCLGATPILYTLFSRHLNIHPKDKKWANRDRFVLSAGHSVPMLYSTLYMLGYLKLDDLKKLRKINSNTPGHPEIETEGIDIATGPLGFGIASAVGMAIGERYLNTINKTLFNHYTYVLCGDGDLMEGVSYEALSLAGKLKLNKLIILYDSNDTTLDGSLDKSNSEDIISRFAAINFDCYIVNNGDSVYDIDVAINKAKKSLKPSIIVCKTKIGKYSKNEGSNITHGKPLDLEDISNIKNKLDIYDSPFTVSSDSVEYFYNKVINRVSQSYKTWSRCYNNLKENDLKFINKILNNKTEYNIDYLDINFNNESLRDLSGNILNQIANNYKLVIGGSADLSSSCKTYLKDLGTFDSNNYGGRNIYFGVREHAMGCILNGISLMGLRPFGSTFLVFSDYLRPSIRMSAIMNLPVLYIFTHDSITVGEDGKTHEPIEQLASLELIPNLKVYHPFDLNELISCYKEIYNSKNPSVLVLPRDSKEISDLTKCNKIENGAYIIKKEKNSEYVTLLSSGEVLKSVLEVSEELNLLGYDTRIVSMPCYKNFMNLNKENRNKILSKESKIIGVTYGVKERFLPFTENVIGLNEFGLSGSKNDILEHFKLDTKGILERILEIINEK